MREQEEKVESVGGKAWIPGPALLVPSGVTPGQKEFYFLSLSFLICKMGTVVASISQRSCKNGRTFCGLLPLLGKFLFGPSGDQLLLAPLYCLNTPSSGMASLTIPRQHSYHLPPVIHTACCLSHYLACFIPSPCHWL